MVTDKMGAYKYSEIKDPCLVAKSAGMLFLLFVITRILILSIVYLHSDFRLKSELKRRN